MWVEIAAVSDPLPIEVVNNDPSWFEMVAGAVTALGTLAAVAVSVWVAVRASRDRREEAAARKAAESALAAEQKAIRQAVHVSVETRWLPWRAGSGERVTGDLHARMEAAIFNGSKGDIVDVRVVPLSPLVSQVPPPLDGSPEDQPLSNEVDRIPGGFPHRVEGIVYTRTQTPPDPPPAAVEFTDAMGDRWRRDPDGSLTLRKSRRIVPE